MPPPPGPYLTEEEEDGLRSDPELGGVTVWLHRLTPLHRTPTQDLSDLMSGGEGWRWIFPFRTPISPAKVVRGRFESPRVAELRLGFSRRLHKYLKAGWIDHDAEAQVLALRPPVAVRDTLFAGWSIGPRNFRFWQTREEGIVVRVTADLGCGESPARRLSGALELARDILNIPGEPCGARWWSSTFGRVVVGSMTRELCPWYRRLEVVIDETSIWYHIRDSYAPWPDYVEAPLPPGRRPPWFEE